MLLAFPQVKQLSLYRLGIYLSFLLTTYIYISLYVSAPCAPPNEAALCVDAAPVSVPYRYLSVFLSYYYLYVSLYVYTPCPPPGGAALIYLSFLHTSNLHRSLYIYSPRAPLGETALCVDAPPVSVPYVYLSIYLPYLLSISMYLYVYLLLAIPQMKQLSASTRLQIAVIISSISVPCVYKYVFLSYYLYVCLPR